MPTIRVAAFWASSKIAQRAQPLNSLLAARFEKPDRLPLEPAEKINENTPDSRGFDTCSGGYVNQMDDRPAVPWVLPMMYPWHYE